MKRMLTIAVTAFALSAPAFAQEPTTLQLVTTKGVTIKAQGMEIPITYKPDGTYSLEIQGQAVDGKWRIDGEKLCTSSSFQPEERCTAYPAGKKSGDEFEVQGAMGAMTVKIN